MVFSLMQIFGLLYLVIKVLAPAAAIWIIIHAAIVGALDFEHRGLRALFRLALCPLLLVFSDVFLMSLYEFLTTVFYIIQGVL